MRPRTIQSIQVSAERFPCIYALRSASLLLGWIVIRSFVRPFRAIMRITLLGLIALIAGCYKYPPASDNAPIDEGWQPANGAIIEPIDAAPTVTILERRSSSITIEISNIGTEALEYGSRNDNSISMFREIETNGKWTFDAFDWCGMGIERRVLQPGQSIKVDLKFDLPLKRERLLGSFSQQDTEKHSYVVLACESSEQN